MWVPPRLEMSKHSIRIGTASSPSARCSPSSASARLSRRRSARSCSSSSASTRVARGQLEDPALLAALGGAHLDRPAAALRERLGERLALDRRELALHDDQRGDRGVPGVVLQHELLDHLGHVALGLVGEVERLAVGEHAVAHLEDLRVGVASRRARPRPRRACRPPRWPRAGAPAASAPRAGGCARAPPARTPAPPPRRASAPRARARSRVSGRRGSRSRGRCLRGSSSRET